MILTVNENTFNFVRIDGYSEEQMMQFRFRRLKSMGDLHVPLDLTGIEFEGAFRVVFKNASVNTFSNGDSINIHINVPYSGMIWEFINTPTNINTRLSETVNQPVEFERFFNRGEIPCITYREELSNIINRYNSVEYTPKYMISRNSVEIEVNESEFEIDLSKYDLSAVDEIIIVHMHTSNLAIHNLPSDFIESDEYDQELSINFRVKLKDKDRLQFKKIGLIGDDPCITKFIRASEVR